MIPEEFSPLSLYGDKAVFEEMKNQGCDQVQSGVGEWVEDVRVVHIFVFLREGNAVAALLQEKATDSSLKTHQLGRSVVKWGSQQEAQEYFSNWAINLGPKTSLSELLGTWTV